MTATLLRKELVTALVRLHFGISAKAQYRTDPINMRFEATIGEFANCLGKYMVE
jgi:hypothetical protein